MSAEYIELMKTSQWSRLLLPLMPLVVLFMVAGIIWSIFMRRQTEVLPILGGKRFERLFLARKKRPKKSDAKT